MNKYIIHCTTAWCGVYEDYSVLAYSESELYDIAEELAYNLFSDNEGWIDIAEEKGYDVDEMTEEDWDKLYNTVDESMYYNFDIECVDESDSEQLEEWSNYDLIYQSDEII